MMGSSGILYVFVFEFNFKGGWVVGIRGFGISQAFSSAGFGL